MSDQALQSGDSIELSVTHEIVIGREKSWIKLGSQSLVRTGETADDAVDRVSSYLSTKVLQVIEDQVTAVREYEEKTR